MHSLYPLRFEPIFKSMLWGGRRLPELVRQNGPTEQPIGEVWLLSDVDANLSVVRNGPWAGTTLRELLQRQAELILGVHHQQWQKSGQFPLLLKFIDAQRELSVQVHPDDKQAARLGTGLQGKTEAWVVLDRHPERSRIYAGLRPGVTEAVFRQALEQGCLVETLHHFVPQIGDCLFLPAGTVHALGAELLVFEIQQTSDITYRLYDWDRVDPVTGQPRPLHIAEGLSCIDWSRGPCHPVQPAVIVQGGLQREGLIHCRYFTLERWTVFRTTTVDSQARCRILVALNGTGALEWNGQTEPLLAGDVLLIPATLETIRLTPASERLTLLACGLGEESAG
jgi:mannose-6-phosphate isomerase